VEQTAFFFLFPYFAANFSVILEEPSVVPLLRCFFSSFPFAIPAPPFLGETESVSSFFGTLAIFRIPIPQARPVLVCD